MENSIKTRLLTYGAVSGFSFVWLMLAGSSGIGVVIFFALQLAMIYMLIREIPADIDRRGLILFVPIIVLASNYFTSGSSIWRATDAFALIILYSVMVSVLSGRFSTAGGKFKFIYKTLLGVAEPLVNCCIPFKWLSECRQNSQSRRIFSRVAVGILISVPAVIFLILMLSSADMVFSLGTDYLLNKLRGILDLSFVAKAVLGIGAGLYLFGMLYILYEPASEKTERPLEAVEDMWPKGDVLILDILLASVVIVYTVFMAVQFKYLFAGSQLPDGLNYAQYARRGFFELVFLSVLNVCLILAVMYLLRDVIGGGLKNGYLPKFLMLYLCGVTLLLLISSFYRMSLYDGEYGLTRLRTLVYGFLIFESVGILATAAYILKPKFNIVFVYAVICLVYYMVLNIIQIDSIIAWRNIDMYMTGQTDSIDMEYLCMLSADAAPQVARLIAESDVPYYAKKSADEYFAQLKYTLEASDDGWQCFNLSRWRADKIIEDLNFND